MWRPPAGRPVSRVLEQEEEGWGAAGPEAESRRPGVGIRVGGLPEALPLACHGQLGIDLQQAAPKGGHLGPEAQLMA